MRLTKGLFTSASQHWATPMGLYASLDAEFHFDDDPCPLHGSGGLDRPWGLRTYCNPPYGRQITAWIRRGWEESQKGKLVVMLIPSRTDTRWWHEYVMKATEIRFVRGRLYFNDGAGRAPFPSAIVIFDGKLEAGL